MGQLVCAAVDEDDTLELVGCFDSDDIHLLDTEAPKVDLVIDFSRPEALPHIVAFCKRTGAALLTGTTGISEEAHALLDELGSCSPVVWASNFSLGVAVLRRATAVIARELAGFDCEIVEVHHAKKVDSPSGTAMELLEAVDPKGEAEVVYGRQGTVGERKKREIGMHAVRGGTVAGTHEVHFYGQDEELCLTHRSISRKIFVVGAVACAKRLIGRGPGRYTFDDLMFG
jgi:4-hydroxy-tetrahydrodipicolinate reductase